MEVNSIAQAVLFYCLLIVASVWDIKKRIIPDTLCVLVLMTGLVCFTPSNILGILLGLPLLLGELVAQHKKTSGIGGGDIKLTAACGFVLGLRCGLTGLLVGLLAFCLFYLVQRICKRQPHGTAKNIALPMSPFLSLSFIAAHIIYFGGFTL